MKEFTENRLVQPAISPSDLYDQLAKTIDYLDKHSRGRGILSESKQLIENLRLEFSINPNWRPGMMTEESRLKAIIELYKDQIHTYLLDQEQGIDPIRLASFCRDLTRSASHAIAQLKRDPDEREQYNKYYLAFGEISGSVSYWRKIVAILFLTITHGDEIILDEGYDIDSVKSFLTDFATAYISWGTYYQYLESEGNIKNFSKKAAADLESLADQYGISLNLETE